MLLTITNTHKPATDLSFLLHKHPNRIQTFDLAFGKAHVFYSVANDEICTANLLLDVDTIGLVRRKDKQTFALEQYVNDRPFVASSFFSVAIASVFRSALNGKCDAKQDVADSKLPLVAEISALQCKQGEAFLRELFEPLGYDVEITQHILDECFTDWGASDYFTVKLSAEVRLADLLSHLYVLIPVLDNKKHYFIDEAEVEKLLRHGEKWLANHPQRETITQRYLKRKNTLIREALSRLIVEEGETESEFPQQIDEEILEKPILLNEQRYIAVLKELQTIGAKRVVDVGCGEGRLLKAMFETRNFDEIVGLDVSHRTLEIASERLKIERLPVHQQEKIKLIHGSLTYKDARISNFDAATVIEVIEHLDFERLATFERVLFGFAKPRNVILTTPNVEYNQKFENLSSGKLRHADHRFEWTRNELQSWALNVCESYGYNVEFRGIGDEDSELGTPTQMAVFTKQSSENQREIIHR